MTKPEDTIRVVIPLTIRKRNGRPKILPPEGVHAVESHSQDSHILKALGRAWAWRRKLENGEVATAGELAKIKGVTERFVSRTVRLAYLSPEAIDCFLIYRKPVTLRLPELISSSLKPWAQQSTSLLHSDGPNESFGKMKD